MKSDDIDDPRGSRGPLIDRIVRRAQAALLWESAWPWLASALGVVVAFLTVSWLGLWDALPPLARAAGVLLFAAALIAALVPLRRAVAPDRRAALTRVDRASGVAHRPATSLDDRLASTSDDAFTRALWSAHRERMGQDAKKLRVGQLAPKLAARDPYALRFLLGLVAVAAFAYAGADRTDRVLAAFDWRTPVAEATPARLDAWVAPPGYTGRAPIFLTARPAAAGGGEATPENTAEVIRAPANSTIVVRGSGGTVDVQTTGAAQALEAPKSPEGVTEKRFKLTGDAELRVAGAGSADRVWKFAAIPDEKPTIALSGQPKQNARGTATVAYEVKDDYGVVQAEARFALIGDEADKATGGSGPDLPNQSKRPLYEAPKVNLALPRAKAREGKAETSIDVQEHPWAGAWVTMTLRARDEAGQEGFSKPVEFRLPAKPFTKPLARALVEQRRILALDANSKPHVLAALKALMLYPEQFTPQAGVFLGLTTAHRRLDIAQTDDELRDAADYLWQIALRIEDGELGEAEKELRAAQDALQKALENGASEKELQKLTQDLRQALEKFMKEMAEQNRQNQQNAQNQRNQRGDAKTVRPQDLRNMIDKMEQLQKQGAKDAAKQALNDLRNMLDNLQNAQKQQQADPNQQAQQQQMDKLQDMIREQGKLRDKTFQQYRQNEQTQRNQRQQPGRKPQNGQIDKDNKDLAQQQKQLKEALDQLMKEQGEQGGNEAEKQAQGGQEPEDNPDAKDGKPRDPGGDQNQGEQQGGQSQDEAPGQKGKNALSSAGKSMGEAQGSLGEGKTGDALDSQQKAIESLRKGAQALAQQMQQNGKGKPGQNGQPGEGEQGAQNGDGGEDNDPLGRPTRRKDSDGNTTKVPGEIETQRARRVLEELRKRLGENERSREELDYIERLLTP